MPELDRIRPHYGVTPLVRPADRPGDRPGERERRKPADRHEDTVELTIEEDALPTDAPPTPRLTDEGLDIEA